ncbi:recombinase family protein [Alsobacter sp. R-9]
MRRGVIYGRYSTDLQNEKSVEDQFSLCRVFASRERLQIVATYEDRAVSGASIAGRPGVLALLADASKGRFEVLLVEALDRLSRDIADLGHIHKTFSFLGIDIIGVSDGGRPADTILIGLRGLVGQLFREDGAKKVKRGMVGLVNRGKHAGGRAFGYRPALGQRGEPQIVPEQADIVRRIFSAYIGGLTPRQIAYTLNSEGVPPPRGRSWNASTINGSPQRGNGIIQNELYAGVVVWNKIRMIKNPVNGRRVSRPNPPEAWIRCERPDLAIVDRETFEQANSLKRLRGTARPEYSRRNVRLFSGLLQCGCCGSGFATAGVDRSQRVRIRCSRHAESGTCPDPRSYYLSWVEGTVLRALKSELRDRRAIYEAASRYRHERAAHLEANRLRRIEVDARLSALTEEMDRLTDFLARGVGDPIRIDQRCQQGRIEEETLRAELSALDDAADDLVPEPATVTDYLRTVTEFRTRAKRGTVAADSPEAVSLRALVKSVVLVPRRDEGRIEVEITARLRPLCRKPKGSGLSGGTLVAEEGLEPPTQGL